MLKNMSRKTKLILGGIITLVVIGLLGSCGGSSDQTADKADSKVAVPASTQSTFTLPDYAGKTLDIAMNEMTAHGINAVAVDSVDDKTVLSPKNWVVENSDPAVGAAVAEGDTVTFNVSKPGAAEAKAEAEKVAAEKAKEPTETPSGLSSSMASVACDHEGDAEFPYGYKAHWIIGSLAKRVEGDQWFLKAETTVTNAFKAKNKNLVTECYVGGTEDAPVVTSFTVY